MGVLHELISRYRPKPKEVSPQNTSINFGSDGTISLSEKDCVLTPQITGLPYQLIVSDSGNAVQLLPYNNADPSLLRYYQQATKENHLRLFVIQDGTYQKIYSESPDPKTLYETLKQTDTSWQQLISGKQIKPKEDYWLIAKWITNPENGHRTFVPDIARFKISPQEKTVRQVFTEQMATCNKGDSFNLSLLCHDADLLITDTPTAAKLGHNVLVLKDIAGPQDNPLECKPPPFEIKIRYLEGTYQLIIERPPLIITQTQHFTIDETPPLEKYRRVSGPNKVFVGDQMFTFSPNDDVLIVPLVDGDIKITSSSGRRLAQFTLNNNKLIWKEGTEKGTWRFSRGGEGTKTYDTEETNSKPVATENRLSATEILFQSLPADLAITLDKSELNRLQNRLNHAHQTLFSQDHNQVSEKPSISSEKIPGFNPLLRG